MATFVRLKRMPYDRPDQDGQLVHATGMGILESDGIVVPLYEDDPIYPGDDDVIIDEDELN